MSGPAEQWAWQLQDERLSLSEKFVLVYLARRAYYDDGCGAWPSVNTIAAHCHCTRRSVLRALKRLQELGYLREGDQELAARNPRSHEPIPRGHRSKVWDVVMKGAQTEPEDIHRSRRDRRRQGRSNETQYSRTIAEQGVRAG